MRTRGPSPLMVATLAIAITAACADPVSTPATNERGAVLLVSPASDAIITQNDSTLGCSSDILRGYGFRSAFDWEDVSGANGYFVRLKRTGSPYPAIDHTVNESSLDLVNCNSFVIDDNLTGWIWSVAAVAYRADTRTLDTLWSEERTYRFAPCRHPDGRSCRTPLPPMP